LPLNGVEVDGDGICFHLQGTLSVILPISFFVDPCYSHCRVYRILKSYAATLTLPFTTMSLLSCNPSYLRMTKLSCIERLSELSRLNLQDICFRHIPRSAVNHRMKKLEYASLLATHYVSNCDNLTAASTSSITSRLPSCVERPTSRISAISAVLEFVYGDELALHLRSSDGARPATMHFPLYRQGMFLLWNHDKKTCIQALERDSRLDVDDLRNQMKSFPSSVKYSGPYLHSRRALCTAIVDSIYARCRYLDSLDEQTLLSRYLIFSPRIDDDAVSKLTLITIYSQIIKFEFGEGIYRCIADSALWSGTAAARWAKKKRREDKLVRANTILDTRLGLHAEWPQLVLRNVFLSVFTIIGGLLSGRSLRFVQFVDNSSSRCSP
jgi:hypothetical protein